MLVSNALCGRILSQSSFVKYQQLGLISVYGEEDNMELVVKKSSLIEEAML